MKLFYLIMTIAFIIGAFTSFFGYPPTSKWLIGSFELTIASLVLDKFTDIPKKFLKTRKLNLK